MMDNNNQDYESIDILGIVENKVPERILVLEGEEYGRRGNSIPIAITKCEITFNDEDNLQRCIQAMRESDEKLKQISPNYRYYDWQSLFRQGMTLIFGVAWYNKEYFESHKDVYKNEGHMKVFEKFGTKYTDFKIKHYPLY